ncbi:LOW QUALITY PROTEIN: zf-RVT domain-containing protein, partial [Cephalotus follicularis]
KERILQLSQFTAASLPIKYLGLPLITSRLTKQDCAPLLAKILGRANSWVSRSLSYAGRLQLIRSTLASMHVFWCSTFLLPAEVIKECERTLRRFLWGGNGSAPKRSLVKWTNICLPRPEGGLGIMSLKKHSFWSLPSTGPWSWVWRKILLFGKALNHLVYVCGKGDKFSLWYDPWFYGSSVYAVYGQRVIYDSGLAKSVLVEAVIENEHWNWPTTSPHLIEIQSRVQGIPISSSSDRIFWEVAGHQFSTKKAWALIRNSAPTVDWARLVWHPARIAKHAFCLLAILNALNTLDKLFHRGILSSASCRFNCGQEESVSHLFFACPFTHHI